jgi:F0F1-type ATP synthase membrane subunit b/b'
MKVEEILSEMEAIILESPRVPFTNKRVIEEDDLASVMDELRDSMPSELADARQLISDRQRILDDAQREAQNIIEQAKTYVVKLTDENMITRQAQEQANELVHQARSDAEELRCGSIRYADEVFKHLEASLGCLTDSVQQSHQSLKGDGAKQDKQK